jgi:hypothetical protein
MDEVYNHTNSTSSLNIRNPRTGSKDILDSALLYPPFGDSCKKARGKISNALSIEPPIYPEKVYLHHLQ